MKSSNKRFWAFFGIGFLSLTAGSELVVRNLGFRPDVSETIDLWSLKRTQVYSNDQSKKKAVIAGASRAQIGIDPQIMSSSLGEQYDVVQISIIGTPPTGVVKDLCNDPKFDGLILFSAIPFFLLPAEYPHSRNDYAWTGYYHHHFFKLRRLDDLLEVILKSRAQDALAILSRSLSSKSIFKSEFQPSPPKMVMTYDRFQPTDFYNLMSDEARKKEHAFRVANAQKRDGTTLDKEKFLQACDMWKGLYTKLKSRGGEMILFRMPTSNGYWSADQRYAPKSEYWDQITPRTGIPTIHFADHPQLSQFDCPDSSHLDVSDTVEFTEQLARLFANQLGRQ